MENQPNRVLDYKQLYENELKKRHELEAQLKEKNDELETLKLLLKVNHIESADKAKSRSSTNSQTAKNGYKEEELVCKDLDNELIKQALVPILGDTYDKCNRIMGNHKCDIQSDNKLMMGQVKKYKHKQFQQIDRHWVSDVVENIPELNDISQILKDLFEYPLLPNGTHIDKRKTIKKLCTTNYSQDTLDNFLDTLNKFKKQILEYACFGTSSVMRPEYLFGVEYENKKRTKLVVFTMKDIICYLERLNFKISPRKTAILLGDGTISLQRKGGDSGRKSSNQLQIKIIISNLIDKVPNTAINL